MAGHGPQFFPSNLKKEKNDSLNLWPTVYIYIYISHCVV